MAAIARGFVGGRTTIKPVGNPRRSPGSLPRRAPGTRPNRYVPPNTPRPQPYLPARPPVGPARGYPRIPLPGMPGIPALPAPLGHYGRGLLGLARRGALPLAAGAIAAEALYDWLNRVSPAGPFNGSIIVSGFVQHFPEGVGKFFPGLGITGHSNYWTFDGQRDSEITPVGTRFLSQSAEVQYFQAVPGQSRIFAVHFVHGIQPHGSDQELWDISAQISYKEVMPYGLHEIPDFVPHIYPLNPLVPTTVGDPISVPVGVTIPLVTPTWVSIPWIGPNIWRSDTEQPGVPPVYVPPGVPLNPVVPRDPLIPPRVPLDPVNPVKPVRPLRPLRPLRPSVVPAVGVIVNISPVPWTPPVVAVHPGGHHVAPPPKGTKEQKRKMGSGALAAVMAAVNGITEGVDLLNALYNALPSNLRWYYNEGRWWQKNRTPQDKAKALWDNLDQLDLSSALQNIVREQIGDLVAGRFGAALGEGSRVGTPGRPVGLGTGPAL